MRPSSPDSSQARRLLVVMRHAKAEAYADEDHARDLTDRGHREAAEAGRWLARHGYVPTHAYVSSARRAQSTWAEVARRLETTPVVAVEDGLYAAGPESVLDSLRQAPAEARVVAFVGHNPTAASLAHLLDDGDPDEEAFRAMSEGFATSAMAVLAVPGDWSDLEPVSARLVAFYRGHG